MKPKKEIQAEQDKKRLLVQIRLNQAQAKETLNKYGDITTANRKAKELFLKELEKK